MQLSLAPNELEALADLVVAKILDKLPKSDDGAMMKEAEAAAHCRVTVNTLREARRRGVLKCSRAGRFPVYSREQLKKWLESKS